MAAPLYNRARRRNQSVGFDRAPNRGGNAGAPNLNVPPGNYGRSPNLGGGGMGPGQKRVKRMQTQLAQLNQARTSGTKPLTQQDTTRLLALKERLGRPVVPWVREMAGLPRNPANDPTFNQPPNPSYSRGGNRRQGPGGFGASAGYTRRRRNIRGRPIGY